LKLQKAYKMGRNNPKNIKEHNDKLHKEQAKAKAKKNARAEKLKEIQRKFKEANL
jgi:benzoyl-CoA reductase/2-hydroxyglutaryl-CoA dehydratase subunit BcrC/BadD/HgdB